MVEEKSDQIFIRPFVSNSQIRKTCRKTLDKQKYDGYNDVTIKQNSRR